MTITVSTTGQIAYMGENSVAPAGGLVKLASGRVGDPVAFIDIALPAGYQQFRLELSDVFFSEIDGIAAVLSQDDGATFLNDTANQDDYFITYVGFYGTQFASFGSTVGASYSSGTINPNGTVDIRTGIGGVCVYEIFPGTTASRAQMLVRGTDASFGTDYTIGSFTAGIALNPQSVVPQAVQRVNLIRLLPLGNGDSNPPTSGRTFLSGSYVLQGVIAPPPPVRTNLLVAANDFTNVAWTKQGATTPTVTANTITNVGGWWQVIQTLTLVAGQQYTLSGTLTGADHAFAWADGTDVLNESDDNVTSLTFTPTTTFAKVYITNAGGSAPGTTTVFALQLVAGL